MKEVGQFSTPRELAMFLSALILSAEEKISIHDANSSNIHSIWNYIPCNDIINAYSFPEEVIKRYLEINK